MKIKKNILPNIIFILAVVVIPICFMALASVGMENEMMVVLAAL